MMTEAEAWRHIAQKFSALPRNEFGLCREAALLWQANLIERRTCIRMGNRVDDNRQCDHGNIELYVWPLTDEFRPVRVLACLFLALEAEDDTNA